jgi:hypothetical protein
MVSGGRQGDWCREGDGEQIVHDAESTFFVPWLQGEEIRSGTCPYLRCARIGAQTNGRRDARHERRTSLPDTIVPAFPTTRILATGYCFPLLSQIPGKARSKQVERWQSAKQPVTRSQVYRVPARGLFAFVFLCFFFLCFFLFFLFFYIALSGQEKVSPRIPRWEDSTDNGWRVTADRDERMMMNSAIGSYSDSTPLPLLLRERRLHLPPLLQPPPRPVLPAATNHRACPRLAVL